MLYKECIRYLNLPQIPQFLLDQYKEETDLRPDMIGPYHSEPLTYIHDWCKENIADVWYTVQIMNNYVPVHSDWLRETEEGSFEKTTCKLVYLVDTGGDDVKTLFYDDNFRLIKSYKIEPLRWHIFQCETKHAVIGVTPERKRWSITGQLLHRPATEHEIKYEPINMQRVRKMQEILKSKKHSSIV